MNVDEQTLLEMMQEVAPDRFQEGDFTVNMLAKELGVSAMTVQRKLHKLLESGGVLKLRGSLPTGRIGYFYRKP